MRVLPPKEDSAALTPAVAAAMHARIHLCTCFRQVRVAAAAPKRLRNRSRWSAAVPIRWREPQASFMTQLQRVQAAAQFNLGPTHFTMRARHHLAF